MADGTYDHEEIAKLREWRHRASGELNALRWRLERLEALRGERRSTARLVAELLVAGCALASLILTAYRL